jgi:hypothetical protein
MNGLIATRERKMLRHHPLIIAAIDRFWHTLNKNPISYDTPDQYCIRWKARSALRLSGFSASSCV